MRANSRSTLSYDSRRSFFELCNQITKRMPRINLMFSFFYETWKCLFDQRLDRKKITGKSETKNLENLTDGLTFQCFNFRENTHISSIFRRLSLSHFWSFLDNSFTYVAMWHPTYLTSTRLVCSSRPSLILFLMKKLRRVVTLTPPFVSVYI